MTALAAPRNIPRIGTLGPPAQVAFPVADNVKIYPGALLVLNASGYVEPATTAVGKIPAGVYRGSTMLDNTVTGHAAANFLVPVDIGLFKFVNGTDAVAQADVGSVVFVVDDQTISKTDGNGAQSPAGHLMQVDTDGVWVLVGSMKAAPSVVNPKGIVTIPVPALAAVANSGVLARFTPGFAGRLLSAAFMVATAATTGSKAATLTPAIATVATTGGAIALTSANCTPIGASVAGSAITAANTFTAAQEITVVASGVTAFIEGAGAIVLTFG